MLARQAGFRPTELPGAIYSHRNCDAARHLYRVTSGLESMIVGEAEIQGQVRRSFDPRSRARPPGRSPPSLQGGAPTGGACAARRGSASAHSACRRSPWRSRATSLASWPAARCDPRDRRDGELTARALAASGGRLVVRRHPPARPRGLPRPPRPRQEPSASTSCRRARARRRRPRGDLLAAPADRGRELAEVLASRDGRPLLLIDLAVPRDIDAACGDLAGVSLYDIDDLQAVIARNRWCARARRARAEGIIEEEIQRFAVWLGSLEVMPTLAALRASARRSRRSSSARTPAGGRSRLGARPRACRRDRARDRQPPPGPPDRADAELQDERVHARMALVRDLFDLDVEEGVPGRSAAQAPAAPAELRFGAPTAAPLRRRQRLMRIGTRGSALALAQATWVAEQLGRGQLELVHVTMPGDRGGRLRTIRAGSPSSSVRCSRRDRCRRAFGQGCARGARRARRWRRSRPARTRATYSVARPRWRRGPRRPGGDELVRRAAQIRALARTSLVALRGNVDTRLRKLAAGEADAIVLALAGLARLGRANARAGGVPRPPEFPRRGRGHSHSSAAPPRPQARRSGCAVGPLRRRGVSVRGSRAGSHSQRSAPPATRRSGAYATLHRRTTARRGLADGVGRASRRLGLVARRGDRQRRRGRRAVRAADAGRRRA